MSCRCADRWRHVLPYLGYALDAGYWVKGDHRFADADVDQAHFAEAVSVLYHTLTAPLHRLLARG